jgi:molybdopterin converting factor small subunit
LHGHAARRQRLGLLNSTLTNVRTALGAWPIVKKVTIRMKIELLLFAAIRQRLTTTSLQVELPEESTISDLRQVLERRYPELAGILTYSLFAVGPDYVSNTFVLTDQMVVAWIPPVSGG